MRADDEIANTETFGPLVGVARFGDWDEAMALANGHGYGLSSAIYTNDPKTALRFREQVSAGMVSVNNSTSGAEAHLPFGGNGKSGNGSRQSGVWVLEQFTRWQSMNWDYAGKLQKAQMDVLELPADLAFALVALSRQFSGFRSLQEPMNLRASVVSSCCSRRRPRPRRPPRRSRRRSRRTRSARSPTTAGSTTPSTEFAEGAEPQSTHGRRTTARRSALRATYVGRKAAEPTMGVDKHGRAFFAAADFDGAGGAAARTEIWRTTDDNRSFQEVTPQVGGQDIPPTTLDPYVYVDHDHQPRLLDRPRGRRHVVPELQRRRRRDVAAERDERARRQRPPDVLLRPAAEGQPAHQHDDRQRHLLLRQRAHVRRLLVQRRRRADVPPDRRSRSRPGCVGCQTGHGIVDPDGRAIIPKGRIAGVEIPEEFRPSVIISDNGGLSWRERFVADAPFSSSRHTAVASDRAGNLYYVWYDDEHKLPYLAISRDHGETWGKPIMVAPPGVHDANFPMVAAGEAGRVAISFPGSSVNDPDDETRPWHAWVAVSTNALDENPLFVAAPANDVERPDPPRHVRQPLRRDVRLPRPPGLAEGRHRVGDVHRHVHDGATSARPTREADLRDRRAGRRRSARSPARGSSARRSARAPSARTRGARRPPRRAVAARRRRRRRPRSRATRSSRACARARHARTRSAGGRACAGACPSPAA